MVLCFACLDMCRAVEVVVVFGRAADDLMSLVFSDEHGMAGTR